MNEASSARTDGTVKVNMVQEVVPCDTEAANVTLEDVTPKLTKAWWRVPHIRKLNIVLLAALLTPATNGFDGSMMNGLQTLPVWQQDFNHPSGVILGIMGTINTIGFIVALPLAWWIADFLGRRRPIQIGSLIMIVGAALQAASQNIAMFLVARFLLGFGISIAAVASPALIAELSYPSQRGPITAMYNTNWFVGSIVAAWSTFGTFQLPNSWSWRIPSLLQGVPSLIQIVLSFWLPESPRWLIYKERRDEAARVLARYHTGDTDATMNRLVTFQMAEITSAIHAEKLQKATRFRTFVETKGNRHRLLILVVLGVMQQASGNTLISYFLAIILNQVGITSGIAQNGINGGLQVFNYMSALGSAVLVDRFGRRAILLAAFAGMFVCYLIWTVLSAINEQQGYANPNYGVGVVVLIFGFNFFYAIGMTPIPFLYLSEILPFSLRAKGMMISSFAGIAIGLMLGLVNPIALENIGWRYYIVSVVLLVIWLMLTWLCFPETKGRSLENIATIFDGEDALLVDIHKGTSAVHKENVDTAQ